MNARDVMRALFGSTPFFGGETCGEQSPAAANLLLTALVDLSVVRNRPACVLEIGSWVGFSTLSIAHALAAWSPTGGEVVCIDPWLPYFTPEDLGTTNKTPMDNFARADLAFDLFMHNVSTAPANVTVRPMRGRAADILPTIPPNSCDLVYIDGSHYYADVKSDIEQAQRLVRDGGILAGDDLEVQLDEIDERKLRHHLKSDYVVDAAEQRGYHPGVTLAVGEAFGHVSAVGPTWFLRRSGDRFVSLEQQSWRMIIPPHFPPDMAKEARRLLGISETPAR